MPRVANQTCSSQTQLWASATSLTKLALNARAFAFVPNNKQ